jgi:hypothetical protein
MLANAQEARQLTNDPTIIAEATEQLEKLELLRTALEAEATEA